MITVEKVVTKRDIKNFVGFPYGVYDGDRNWVAPLVSDELKRLNPNEHPFFEHAEAGLFMAQVDGIPVGRIAAIRDELFEEHHGERVAYWGYFESFNDPNYAKALFDSALDWARERGCTRMIGPLSPSANDVAGLLVDGFDEPPVLMMSYNPQYYEDLIEGYGHKKWKDLFAWLISDTKTPERLEKMVPKLEKRGKFKIRPIDMDDWDNEIARARDIYNEFEQVNSIYTPMTEKEFGYMAKDLKQIVDPDMILFAEVDDEPVGVSITLPDFNISLKHARGKLFPLGLAKILWSANVKKEINKARVMAMGVLDGFQKKGIDVAFYYHSYKNGIKNGYDSAELSWVEEDNVIMNNIAKKLGADCYKTYRIFEHEL